MTSTNADEAFNRYMDEEDDSPRPHDLWITSGGDTSKYKKLLEKHGFIPKPNARDPQSCEWLDDETMILTLHGGHKFKLKITRVRQIKTPSKRGKLKPKTKTKKP
jgi:hypothetical protein